MLAPLVLFLFLAAAHALPLAKPNSTFFDDILQAGKSHAKRTQSPGSLYGDNGVPDLADLDQTSIPDCGLISTLGALVSHDPRWITNLISFSGDQASTPSATFSFHWDLTKAAEPQTVLKSTGLTKERSDASDSWWVGGVEQAIRQSGRDVALRPDVAIEALTGRPATYFFLASGSQPKADALTADQLWATVSTYAENTPMILQSGELTQILQVGHAFWLVSAEIVDGKRSLTLWNPHGEMEVHDFDTVWPDCYALYSFKFSGETPAASTR